MIDSDVDEDIGRSKRIHKPSEKARDNAEILAGEEFVPLESPSKWTADALKYLGVKFNIHKTFNLLNYLKQKTRYSWTSDHQNGTYFIEMSLTIALNELNNELRAYEMKQVLNIPPMFLDSLHQRAPKRNAIFLELYNVAKSVDPKSGNRPQSSESASTNLSGTSDQSKSESATDKLASTVVQQAMLAVPQQVTWAPDRLSFFRRYLILRRLANMTANVSRRSLSSDSKRSNIRAMGGLCSCTILDLDGSLPILCHQ